MIGNDQNEPNGRGRQMETNTGTQNFIFKENARLILHFIYENS